MTLERKGGTASSTFVSSPSPTTFFCLRPSSFSPFRFSFKDLSGYKMSFYDILGVSKDASQREIKNAWRELVLKVSSPFSFLPPSPPPSFQPSKEGQL